jgi:hypothetical protein
LAENVNLDRIGGTQQSGANVIDAANTAIRVNVVTGGAGGGAVTVADGADVAQGAKADAAWVSGDGTVIALLKKIASAGGSAVSVADGADVAQGTTTDAAVVSDVSGTLSGKLRGLVKIFADVWDSVNHRLNVAVGGNVTAVQATGTNLHVVVDSAPSTAVTGPLTDTQLRATAVPVSSTTLATSAKQDTGNTSLSNIDTHIDVALSTRTKPSDQQHAIVDSGTLTAVTAITNALPAGTNVIGHVIVDTAPSTAVTVASLPLPSNAAQETGGNLATAATQLTTLLGLLLAQATSATSATGPMVQGSVSDAPLSYLEGYLQPLSLTTEGRLRVSTSPSSADMDVWGGFTYSLSRESFFLDDSTAIF